MIQNKTYRFLKTSAAACSFFFLIFLISITVNAPAQQQQQLYLPRPSGKIYHRTGFSLQYNEAFEQADWVAYELTSDEASGNIKRRDNFMADPEIETGSALPGDYRGSGYDRGHLAPAGDMKWSEKAMTDSFYMSNMSPQDPEFNRRIWKELEELVRKWAFEDKKLLIAAGPIIIKRYSTIGNNRVAVPAFFFKVIADITEPDLKAIGFIIPNKKTSAPLPAYAVPVDYIENITGIDFFYQLDDITEKRIEAEMEISEWWPWK